MNNTSEPHCLATPVAISWRFKLVDLWQKPWLDNIEIQKKCCLGFQTILDILPLTTIVVSGTMTVTLQCH